MKPIAIAVLSLLALSACKDEPKTTAGGTAQGEVLPGSASDAMLPLDTLKSQAPLAPKAEGAAGDKADAKPGAKVADKPKAASKPEDDAVPAEADDVPPAETK